MHSAREFLACSPKIAARRSRVWWAAAAILMAAAPAHAQVLKVADPGEQGDGTLGAAAARAISHGPLPFSEADVAAKVRANRRALKSAAGDERAAGNTRESRTPTVLLNQPGKTDTTDTPPDTTGAIGTKRFVQLVNRRVGIYDHDDGTLVRSGSLNKLAGLASGVNSFNPQIIWDGQTKRFYYVMDSIFSATDNRLSFGFSTTASPNNLTTDWCHYTLEFGTRFPDYPKLGDSQYFLIIGANSFSGANFLGSDITAISKPRGGATCPEPKKFKIGTRLNLVDANGAQVFTPVPAQQVDTSDTGYVAARNGDLTSSATKLWFFNVTRDAETHLPVFGAARGVNVSSYAIPSDATQPTFTQTLDTLDARLTQAVQAIDPDRGRFAFWTQHTIANGSLSGVRWYEIDPEPAVPTVLRSDTIQSGSSFFFNAAISPDRQRDGATVEFGDSFVIEYNVSGRVSGLSPRIVSGSSFSGGPTRFTLVKMGVGPYRDFSCPNDGDTCRWGGYSAATPDPRPSSTRPLLDRGVVWGTNQFSGVVDPPADGANWVTQIFSAQP
jgi:hypothetical protein